MVKFLWKASDCLEISHGLMTISEVFAVYRFLFRGFNFINWPKSTKIESLENSPLHVFLLKFIIII